MTKKSSSRESPNEGDSLVDSVAREPTPSLQLQEEDGEEWEVLSGEQRTDMGMSLAVEAVEPGLGGSREMSENETSEKEDWDEARRRA